MRGRAARRGRGQGSRQLGLCFAKGLLVRLAGDSPIEYLFDDLVERILSSVPCVDTVEVPLPGSACVGAHTNSPEYELVSRSLYFKYADDSLKLRNVC